MKYDTIIENILNRSCVYSSTLKAPNHRPKEYNQAALRKGTRIELSRVADKLLARKIAMQHLDEDEFYYDKLEEIDQPSSS